METLISILIFLILFFLIVVPYFKKLKHKENKAIEKFNELKIKGLNKSHSIHPNINVISCIGCGGCVKACPEGDVLGIINGKATLIHGSKCIGHGLCAKACPIGAIELVMAPPSKSANLPVVNINYETNINGVFIIGELSGISLIRNAIQHAKVAIEFISKKIKSKDDILDLIIIGAGPAGLTSALLSIEKKLNYLVLEQSNIGGTVYQYPRRKMVLTNPIEIPLWGKINSKEIQKEELLKIWTEIISKFKVNIEVGQKLISVKKHENFLSVDTVNNSYKTQNVILALGKRGSPNKLGVNGEELPKVTYQLIDAATYQNQNLMVVGGGDSAIEAALGLALQGTNSVTLSYRKAEFTRIKDRNREKLNEAVSQNKLKIIFNSEVEEIQEKKVILKTTDSKLELDNDYIFILAGSSLPYDLLKSIGIEFHNTLLEK